MEPVNLSNSWVGWFARLNNVLWLIYFYVKCETVWAYYKDPTIYLTFITQTSQTTLPTSAINVKFVAVDNGLSVYVQIVDWHAIGRL